MISEIEEKTQRLQIMMEANGYAGVLLNGQHNFAWLTAGRSNGIDLSRDNGAAFLFVRADGKRFLLANNIELCRLLAEEVSETDFEPIELAWQEEKVSPDVFGSIARSLLRNGGEIMTDIYVSSTLHSIEGLVSACRYQLTASEIGRYRQLGQDTGDAFANLITELSPGETESEIALKVRRELSLFNIFPIVVLVGADERIEKYRHPIPTENVWSETLLIAVCARRHGLIASLTRMICIGSVQSELQRRTEAAALVNAKMQSASVPGAKGSDLYKVAAGAYTDLGFAGEINNHHQGGACGYRTRDWVAHPENREKVKLHQAFAWNPSIVGTKAEVTGIVQEGGFEVISSPSGFPQIVNNVDGIDYYSPGIFSLSRGASA